MRGTSLVELLSLVHGCKRKKKSELGIADQAVLYMMISYIFFLAKNPGVDGVVNIT